MNEEQARRLIVHVQRIADALEAIAAIQFTNSQGGDIADAFADLKDVGFASAWEEAEQAGIIEPRSGESG